MIVFCGQNFLYMLLLCTCNCQCQASKNPVITLLVVQVQCLLSTATAIQAQVDTGSRENQATDTTNLVIILCTMATHNSANLCVTIVCHNTELINLYACREDGNRW